MTWIDLSVPLHSGMPVYPGDPEVRIQPALTVESDGANVLSLVMGSHSGTHADAPLHVSNDWGAIDTLPLGTFSGPAEVADVRNVGPGGAITAAHLSGVRPARAGVAGRLRADRILLLHTGFGSRWGTEEYLSHPSLTADAAQLIVDLGYRTVGLDALSVDPTLPVAGADTSGTGAEFPAHHVLAGAGCVIVENLTGIEHVQQAVDTGGGVEVFLFPLNIPDADGAPIRAVGRLLPAAGAAAQGGAGAPADLSAADVHAAADRLIGAFTATDTDSYFAAFTPEATFAFHTEPDLIESREAYRALWNTWLESGWKVIECRSSEQRIQLLGNTAIFSHRVATTVQTDSSGSREESDERETIVFTRTGDGRVLSVHEHLSARPGG